MDDSSINGPTDHPGCPVDQLSWSGIFICMRDSITGLRLNHDYATQPAYREKVDALNECAEELIARLERLRCLPAPGEPSFTLLGRDPQAAARVLDWVTERQRTTDESLKSNSKIAEALDIAAQMQKFQIDRASGVRAVSSTDPESQAGPA